MMIKKTFVKISLDEINFNDRTFALSDDRDASALIPSIRETGLITPPMLQARKESYRIVLGFKRLAALQALQWSECQLFVVDADVPELDLFLLAVRDRLAQGPLDVVELSNYIFKLQTVFGLDRDQIIKKYLPITGVGRNPRVYELYAGLHKLPRDWQEAVRRDQTPVDLANEMLERSPQEQEAFLALIQSLRLGKNRQREFVQLISDVARLKKCSSTELLALGECRAILEEEKLTPSQKADRLKSWLMHQRYPRFAAAADAFNELIKDQKLPNELSILPPPYFEGERFSVSFGFTSVKEFKNHLAALQRLLDDGIIDKIVKMP